MDKLEKALSKVRTIRRNKPDMKYGRLYAAAELAPAQNPASINEACMERHHIIAHHLRNKEADIFRILRTQILHVMGKSGFRALGITSPNYGDGKTTVALNLAISIALDLKQTVLLADLDLRKPNVTEYLGLDAPYGITDYFAHDTSLSECLVRTTFERLTILPAGRALDNSSEVLGSPKISALAEELRNRYPDRIIIYDMPPVLTQDDPIAFLPSVDAALVVVNNGITRIHEVKQSMNALAGTNVIGTVLNSAPPRKAPEIKVAA